MANQEQLHGVENRNGTPTLVLWHPDDGKPLDLNIISEDASRGQEQLSQPKVRLIDYSNPNR